MTINLALEYIPRRLAELGYGTNYYLRFRHLVLQPKEEKQIKAFNQLYVLVEEAVDVSVYSQSGLFDLTHSSTSEMIYEHQGVITLRNQADTIRHIRFIQVIPKHRTTNNGNRD